LIDTEILVSEEFLKKNQIIKRQSVVLSNSHLRQIRESIKKEGQIIGSYAGGTVGNTLHNYSLISDDSSVLFGVISENIRLKDSAFQYIRDTSSNVDLSYLQSLDGEIGQIFCFITPDGERSFGICNNNSNELNPDFIKKEIISNSSAFVVSGFLFRDPQTPIFASVQKAAQIAKQNEVPIVLSLGASIVVQEQRTLIEKFIQDYVNILALNQEEAETLTGFKDPLLAGKAILKKTDLALITDGAEGLYLCGYVDCELARETKAMIHSKSIAEYNKYEYSRPMFKKQCTKYMQIFSHINPYHGGPGLIKNTNGAGDAALSALLHDLAANAYHKILVPNSPKHRRNGILFYSSMSQICRYANRVSYEVLKQNSARLYRALPEKEESLEEAYWQGIDTN